MHENSSPAVALLGGARARRIDVAGDLALVSVRAEGADWLVVVSARGGAPGLGLVARAGRTRAKAVVGASVARVPPADILGLDDDGLWLLRDGALRRLGPRGATGGVLREEEVGGAPADLAPSGSLETWLDRGTALLDALERTSLDAARRALLAAVAREDARLAKRIAAVAADLARGRAAEIEADTARLFVADAARAPRGTTTLEAVDWTTGEPVKRTMPLDPSKRPRDQVEALFHKARRLKGGSQVAQARQAEATFRRARLAALAGEAEAAASLEALDRARAEALAEDPSLLPGSRPLAAKAKGSKATSATPPPRVPYRTFITTTGARILVGKGAADNDALTVHVARPHDLWLHVKGAHGAHVVVPLMKGHDAPSELLVDAAHLAAHFSDERDETVVDVTYAPKRHVRKRRGSPAGQVQVDREKVLVLRVDPGRLKALLGREAAG